VAFILLQYFVKEIDKEKSIKEIIKREFKLSNRLFTKLKNNKAIMHNSNIAMVNQIPKIGDKITILVEENSNNSHIIKPQEEKLDIIFEDDYLIAINKEQNIVVHPCSYHPDNTLFNFLLGYLNKYKKVTKVHPINRLDRGTSGIVLFAKNEYVQEQYKKLNEIPKKEYIALVYGKFKGEELEGIIDAPISRKEDSIIERKVDFENGKKAITNYKVIKQYKIKDIDVSVLKLIIKTGRTHQIRVHLSYINHPIIGDTLYNHIENFGYENQLLHSYMLSFLHPITKKEITLKTDLPNWI